MMQRRETATWILVLATALALLFLSTAASAQVINGCIKSNGTLKIAETCANNETPISWNVQGPKGDMGDSGMDGAPGAAAEVLHVLDRNRRSVGIFAGQILTRGLSIGPPYIRVLGVRRQAQDAYILFLQRQIKGTLNEMEAERARKNKKIDTRASYDKLLSQCGEW